jgi:hypothetical protein
MWYTSLQLNDLELLLLHDLCDLLSEERNATERERKGRREEGKEGKEKCQEAEKEVDCTELVRLRVYSGYKGIAAETVGGHDTKGYSQRKRLKNLRPQPADFQEELTR